MKSFDIAALLDIPEFPDYLKKVDKKLSESTATENQALQVPLSRLVHARSKRLRSVLVIAAASALGKDVNDKVITGCAAIELIHIASLVHDDIIDNADTRWGIQTVNGNEGVNQAILVGDFLLAKAVEQAASINAEAAGLVAEAWSALIDGESREVADEFNIERSVESMYKAISGKTAALMSAACQMGCICAEVDDARNVFADYGINFGLSFQLVDDVLDFTSTEELIGKLVGNDLKEGVYTLPLLLALQSDKRSEIIKLLIHKPPKFVPIRKILVEEGFINQSLEEAKSFNRLAKNALKNIPTAANMAEIPDKYFEWAYDNIVDPSVREITGQKV